MAEEPLREPDEMSELGTTGLRRSGGFVIDEYIASLRGSRGHRTYREMSENDPVIGSILFAIEKILLRLEWRIDAGGDEEADEEIREFIEECLNDMSDSWDQTLQQILSIATGPFITTSNDICGILIYFSIAKLILGF